MSHMERVVKAVNYLMQVTCINGIVDPDQILSSEYRANMKDFDLEEQLIIFNTIRTMFGDYVLPTVKLHDLFQVATSDQHAIFHALKMAYGEHNEGEML